MKTINRDIHPDVESFEKKPSDVKNVLSPLKKSILNRSIEASIRYADKS